MSIFHIFRKKEVVYFGIRYTTTGIFGYTYRNKENKEVFHISSPVMPNPDITMSGFRQQLIHRHYNGQLTIFPGVRRSVTDPSGKPCGLYECVDWNVFRIDAGASATVKVFRHSWEIYEGPKMVARILRIPQEERVRFAENGCDMEPFFKVILSPDATPALYPYIFAIPMLGF